MSRRTKWIIAVATTIVVAGTRRGGRGSRERRRPTPDDSGQTEGRAGRARAHRRRHGPRGRGRRRGPGIRGRGAPTGRERRRGPPRRVVPGHRIRQRRRGHAEDDDEATPSDEASERATARARRGRRGRDGARPCRPAAAPPSPPAVARPPVRPDPAATETRSIIASPRSTISRSRPRRPGSTLRCRPSPSDASTTRSSRSPSRSRCCWSARSTVTRSGPRSRCCRTPGSSSGRDRSLRRSVSQYVAFLDGRIAEVAYDLYAQDDTGAVWYFGEDVLNFADGVDRRHPRHVDRGRRRAGRDDHAGRPGGRGRVPAGEHPGPGVRGGHRQAGRWARRRPLGPIEGCDHDRRAAHGRHRSRTKTFAPGYGEFLTSGGGDTEALAIAVPTDRAERRAAGRADRAVRRSPRGLRRCQAGKLADARRRAASDD